MKAKQTRGSAQKRQLFMSRPSSPMFTWRTRDTSFHRCSGQQHQAHSGGHRSGKIGLYRLCGACSGWQKPHFEVHRKPTHRDQDLLFDCHHPLEHKPGVIRALQRWAQLYPGGQEVDKRSWHVAIQTGLSSNATKENPGETKRKRTRKEKRNIDTPYVAGESKKRRIFNKH